jgi:hypothetical protein
MQSSDRINVIFGIGLGLAGLGIIALVRKKRQKPLRPAFTNYFGGGQFLYGHARGVRNNNPGNIIMTKTLWEGEIPKEENTDGRFKQFYKYSDGVKAIITNLKSYYKRGLRTIFEIISKWAPDNENNTLSYIGHVSDYMGVSSLSPISFDKATIQKLVEAIIIRENGKLYLKQGQFDSAWKGA